MKNGEQGGGEGIGGVKRREKKEGTALKSSRRGEQSHNIHQGAGAFTTGEATPCAYLCHLACIQLGGVNWDRGCTVMETCCGLEKDWPQKLHTVECEREREGGEGRGEGERERWKVRERGEGRGEGERERGKREREEKGEREKERGKGSTKQGGRERERGRGRGRGKEERGREGERKRERERYSPEHLFLMCDYIIVCGQGPSYYCTTLTIYSWITLPH